MTAASTAPRQVEAFAHEPEEAFEQRLLAWLKQRGKLGDGDIARLQRVRAEDAGVHGLARLLSKLELVSGGDVAEALAELHGIPLASASDYPDAALLADVLPRRFLREHLVVPIAATAERVVLALSLIHI